jgi:S-(hydroxymethyl)glutathione dehydrogenase/alcohol dehydrogenase
MAKRFGATHTYSSIDEAMEQLGDSTWGRGFDVVIMTMGVGDGAELGKAFWLGSKRARIVVTNIHPTSEQSIQVPGAMLTLFEKRIIGSLFGSANIRKDIPRLMELYTQGQYNLDDLVTRTYTLDQVNEGYDAMRAGENIRGVIVFD